MMDQNKIAFIYLCNDKQKLEISLEHVNKLKIPSGIEIEIIILENESSMCSGYNKAMRMSNAKYKVYLHQDTNILNIDFIPDCIELFKQNDEIGILGMIGTKKLDGGAIWWHGSIIVGQVYSNICEPRGLLKFNEPVANGYESVEAVDGLIMITQYDIKWREDIFEGWHFYDLSQSQEFLKHGYITAVPSQKTTWCFHDDGWANSMSEYDMYLDRFAKEYL